MPDVDNQGFRLTFGHAKAITAVIAVCATLFSGVRYAINKIDEHDTLLDRVARLEAKEPIIDQLRDGLNGVTFKFTQNDSTLKDTITKVDTLTRDVVEVRIRIERLSAEQNK
jgi:hypothetical protein